MESCVTFEVGPAISSHELIEVFQTDFRDKTGEIRAALRNATYHSADRREPFNYASAFTGVARRLDNGQVACAALVVPHDIQGAVPTRVWEVVWVNSSSTSKGVGFGTALFEHLHALAVDSGVTAMLVESSTRSLSFWLSRQHDIVNTVMRRYTPQQVKEGRSLMSCGNIVAIESRERHCRMIWELVMRRGAHFSVRNAPPDGLARLYDEEILSEGLPDTLGHATPNVGRVFCGAPYRYDITSSIHVVFPTDAAFISTLTELDLIAHSVRSVKVS